MSDDSNLDRRYAYVWEPFVVAVLVLVAGFIIALSIRSELRDAQRRIAVLEHQCQ